MTKVYTNPFMRINDAWRYSEEVNCNEEQGTICDPIITGYINDYKLHLQDPFIQHIGIDIVAESAFEYPYPFISEKTIRPLINKKMFILLAPAGTLEHLHNYGFKTFAPFINESYDSIINPVDRITAVFEEIKLLCSLSLDEVKENILTYKDILDWNYRNLFRISDETDRKLKEFTNDFIQNSNR